MKTSGFAYLTPSPPSDRRSNLLIDTLSLCGLYQYNGVPNKNGRCLDLILSTIDDVAVIEGTPLSRIDLHHPALSVSLPFSVHPKIATPKPPKHLNYKKCDFAKVRSELSRMDWTSLLTSSDVNENTKSFYDTLQGIIRKYTPYSLANKDRYPLWFSSSLKRCIAEKLKYHKRYKKYKNPRDYDVFAMLRTRSKMLMSYCYNNYIASTESELSKNSKPFWSYVNSKRDKGNAIPSVMKHNDVEAFDSKGMFSRRLNSRPAVVRLSPVTADRCVVDSVERGLPALASHYRHICMHA
ncbi:hypothetical protein ACJJTC_009546 [Scirpophaga incertulas]